VFERRYAGARSFRRRKSVRPSPPDADDRRQSSMHRRRSASGSRQISYSFTWHEPSVWRQFLVLVTRQSPCSSHVIYGTFRRGFVGVSTGILDDYGDMPSVAPWAYRGSYSISVATLRIMK